MEIEIPLSPSKVFYSITKGLIIIVPLCVWGGGGRGYMFMCEQVHMHAHACEEQGTTLFVV